LQPLRKATGSGIIACMGDSNTRGTGSGSGAGGAGGNQGYNGWPVQLAAELTAKGVKSQCENFFGTGGYGGAYASFDDRFTEV
jgi:lysophospholipase L1-like esterase